MKSEMQVMCFYLVGQICKIYSDSAVSADMISAKHCHHAVFIVWTSIESYVYFLLVQKNPGTIRNPEEDKGKEHIILDLNIHLEKASRISPYIYNICSEAKANIYSREQDVRAWSKGKRRGYWLWV